MSELKEAQRLHWEALVGAMKPELDAIQKDLFNKGQVFVRVTDKGIEFIPCEDVNVEASNEPNTVG
jgi:hypothetical protein